VAYADLGFWLFLKGDGTGSFRPEPASESGLLIDGNVREICMIHLGTNRPRGIIAAKNNSFIQVIKINNNKEGSLQ